MLIWFLAGVLGGLLLAEVWLVGLLRRAGVWARPVGVGDLDAVGSSDALPVASMLTRVSRGLMPSPAQKQPDHGGVARCLEGLQWLVEQRPPDAVADDANTADGAAAGWHVDPIMFPHSRRPHCGEIAAVYRYMLLIFGFDSRAVFLRKNIFDPHDSHVSVEVRIDGRWVLIDPTFHATFVGAEGELLGAQEVKAYLFKGRRDAVTPVVHGRALCPLALDAYYVDVLACFNNVFILDDPPRAKLLKLPPMRYAFGPTLSYEKLADESVAHLRVWRQLYLAATLVLPALMVVLVAAAMVVFALA